MSRNARRITEFLNILRRNQNLGEGEIPPEISEKPVDFGKTSAITFPRFNEFLIQEGEDPLDPLNRRILVEGENLDFFRDFFDEDLKIGVESISGVRPITKRQEIEKFIEQHDKELGELTKTINRNLDSEISSEDVKMVLRELISKDKGITIEELINQFKGKF